MLPALQPTSRSMSTPSRARTRTKPIAAAHLTLPAPMTTAIRLRVCMTFFSRELRAGMFDRARSKHRNDRTPNLTQAIVPCTKARRLNDLASLDKAQLGKAFLRQIEIDSAWGQIDVIACTIERDIVAERIDDGLDLIVAAQDPPRCRALVWVENRIDAVF